MGNKDGLKADFLASHLSYDGKTKANRNFLYRVNDAARAAAMKNGIWQLVDQSETTFVSFNYDGIVVGILYFSRKEQDA
jgi:hypothetical protein